MKDYREIRRYLLKEQGYDEEVVKSMTKKELEEAWDEYHEEW